MSGLTNELLKLWTPAVVALVHKHLVHMQVFGAIPDWLKYSWLVPLPKSEDPFTTASNLRPIILLEIMRKVWIGITLKKIQDCWEKPDRLNSTRQRGVAQEDVRSRQKWNAYYDILLFTDGRH